MKCNWNHRVLGSSRGLTGLRIGCLVVVVVAGVMIVAFTCTATQQWTVPTTTTPTVAPQRMQQRQCSGCTLIVDAFSSPSPTVIHPVVVSLNPRMQRPQLPRRSQRSSDNDWTKKSTTSPVAASSSRRRSTWKYSSRSASSSSIFSSSRSSSSSTSTTSFPSTSFSHTAAQAQQHPVCEYHQVRISSPVVISSGSKAATEIDEEEDNNNNTRARLYTTDLTPIVRARIRGQKDPNHHHHKPLRNGVVTVTSQHTTTTLVVNEHEGRLARDMEAVFLKMIPPECPDARVITHHTNQERKRRSGILGGLWDRLFRRRSQPLPNPHYLHNDMHQRPETEDEAQRCLENGWNVSIPAVLQAWRNQEPVNAHAHLLCMLVGSQSTTFPVVNGTLIMGQWQSILLVDLDGPRERTVGIHLLGYD